MALHVRTFVAKIRSYLRPMHLSWRDVVVSGPAECVARAGAGSSTEVPASAAYARDAASAEKARARSLGETGKAES